MNRWRVVVGGVSMNLALGSLYAWSVFVLPLEQEFGWTRSQTSWVYTIAVVVFATSFVLAGRIQDRRGPRPCALAGAILVSPGSGHRPHGGRIWCRIRDLRTGRHPADHNGRLASNFQAAWRRVPRDGPHRCVAARESAAWLSARWLDAASQHHTTPRLFDARDVTHTAVLRALDRVRARNNGRADDDQSVGAVRAQRRARRGCRDARPAGDGGGQRRRPDSLRLVVRCPRPRHDAARDGAGVCCCDACLVCVADSGRAVLRARGVCVLVLWHSALRVCV